jgi:hypothetical protein
MPACFSLVTKWTSAPSTCCFRQRITGVVKTISPIELKRMIKNLIVTETGKSIITSVNITKPLELRQKTKNLENKSFQG